MLYLDYAKPLADGKYILSFFADSVADLESISHGQKFVTKNGTDYGVPQAGSTVIVTSPNSGKTTYVMDAEGIWVVTEDISYSAVVANPSDAATAKLEKLKVNDTTYANWTENEIKSIASEASSGGKLYIHQIDIFSTTTTFTLSIRILSNKAEKFNTNDMFDNKNKIIYQRITDMREGPAKFYECHTIEYTTNINNITVNYFTTYPYDILSRPSFEFTEGSYRFNDSVIEL